MMVRRSVFEEAGGFNEALRDAFNDVDLCLRMRELDYRVLYTPYAELYHHESASRTHERNPEESVYMHERWGETLREDPYYNPNFSNGSGDFNLRADMLRPQLLRKNFGSRTEDYKPLSVMPVEERRSYMADQRRNARDSRRTVLGPASHHEQAAK